jgi:hypothetical protein
MQATQTAAAKATAWACEHPDEMEWIGSNLESNPFALSLAQSLESFGGLTERQLEAVRSNLARPAPLAMDVAEIERRFDVARGNMVKKPMLRLDTFTFKAVIKGQNQGGIYVTEGKGEEGTYLGKIMGGKFIASRDCDDATQARVAAAASDPAAAAKAYGQRTGNCSICGLELTADESIERFIGPVCFRKYFGG